MNVAPSYFEPIRQKAKLRWEQLEADRDLAGPWHQLFKQVQSPRHVVSELLQNADDAGATEASIRLDEVGLVFEHDGEDFTKENFESLCRFGYSNKRTLHTIGFRGIGFKSTFSLGNRVELITPTLAVAFEHKRFTEPIWLQDPPGTGGKTLVRVGISDQHRRWELEKNLAQWCNSPLSLLFCKNIRRVRFGEQSVHWDILRPGPVADSEWMILNGDPQQPYLYLKSKPEAFPEDALEEIREERLLSTEEDLNFPPCRIEIVLGAEGRLFVVLPTGVETELPFACNAPFVQDPARLKIKDLEISPVNRWLLKRAGQLAGTAMLSWLANSDLSIEERAQAYALLSDVDRENEALEGKCGTLVEEALQEQLGEHPVLLGENGKLFSQDDCIALPPEIMSVWPDGQATKYFDDNNRVALAPQISEPDRQQLLNWGLVGHIDRNDIFEVLKSKHLPKPLSWRQLLDLWVYLEDGNDGLGGFHHNDYAYRILPVQGRKTLHAATETVRLGEKKLLQSEDDWEFLSTYLLVLNRNWLRYLSEQRRTNPEKGGERVDAAERILKWLDLHAASDVDDVMTRVASTFFAPESIPLKELVRLAQIAATLGAKVDAEFFFQTRDGYRRKATPELLYDIDGKLEEFVPESLQGKLLLHEGYSKKPKSCTSEEWKKWMLSGRAGISTFIPLVSKCNAISGRANIQKEASRRDMTDALSYPYTSDWFALNDWNYENDYWQHWSALAAEDGSFWFRLVDAIVSQDAAYWSGASAAVIKQCAANGYEKTISDKSLLPMWIVRLRDKPCLKDSHGVAHKPDELLLRTRETIPFLDVEPFVEERLDHETTRPLLKLLGVRSTPTDYTRLMDCLRALAKATVPPATEVDKWYRRLDQAMETCSSDERREIAQTFHNEALILTEDGVWVDAGTVYLAASGEDVPGAATVRPSVRDLSLWERVGVAPRPTADLAIAWLKELPEGSISDPSSLRRVRALLGRYPMRVWMECEHWVNLADQWAPSDNLAYKLAPVSTPCWRHLHLWVREKTADFTFLQPDVMEQQPFAALPALDSQIKEKFRGEPSVQWMDVRAEWMNMFGTLLSRVVFDAEEETARVRTVAGVLAKTHWCFARDMETTPYIGGMPAGTSRPADVVWVDHVLYVGDLPKGRLARRVPEEIAKLFGRPDIKVALDYSFGRSPEDVGDYLEQNFEIQPVVNPEPEALPGTHSESAERHNTASGDKEKPVPEPHSECGVLPPVLQEEPPDEVTPSEMPGTSGNNEIIDSQAQDASLTSQLHPKSVPKAATPCLIERYASAQGFSGNGHDRFSRSDGTWIGRTAEGVFPWEQRTPSGDLMRMFWPRELCLEHEPLELPAEVWRLLELHPETYSLVLVNPIGQPAEISGVTLHTSLQAGRIKFYPAAYRIVQNNEPTS